MDTAFSGNICSAEASLQYCLYCLQWCQLSERLQPKYSVLVSPYVCEIAMAPLILRVLKPLAHLFQVMLSCSSQVTHTLSCAAFYSMRMNSYLVPVRVLRADDLHTSLTHILHVFNFHLFSTVENWLTDLHTTALFILSFLIFLQWGLDKNWHWFSHSAACTLASSRLARSLHRHIGVRLAEVPR